MHTAPRVVPLVGTTNQTQGSNKKAHGDLVWEGVDLVCSLLVSGGLEVLPCKRREADGSRVVTLLQEQRARLQPACMAEAGGCIEAPSRCVERAFLACHKGGNPAAGGCPNALPLPPFDIPT